MAKRYFPKISLTLLLLSASGNLLFGWGVWGHQHINHAAVFALPEEMQVFYYNHIDYITNEAVGPDVRKHLFHDKVEAARHFINIESFAKDAVPITSAEAYKMYDSAILLKYGLLPWNIQDMMGKLTQAFKEKNKDAILFLSADLGHYLGDANMPLHTALNHNGQLTNQVGVHGLWESEIPELFGSNYNFQVKSAVYIKDIPAATWKIIWHTHGLADSLLSIERRVKAGFPKDQVYKTDSSGRIVYTKFGDITYSAAYAAAYNKALNGMVENQLRHAINDIANFWYTAWVNAGKPDLTTIDSPDITNANKENYKKEKLLMEKGELFPFKSINNEYN